MMKRALILVAIVGVLAAGLIQWTNLRDPWIWAYLADAIGPKPQAAAQGPIHILFLVTDQFDPHDYPTMERWMTSYPALAGQHRDADGRAPQQTWFWSFTQSDDEELLRFLRYLQQLVFHGYGEVELSFRHWADLEPAFRSKIGRLITFSQQTGAMRTAEVNPRTAFGLIHDEGALDNSQSGSCGLNNELTLLKELGCYADFTHPWGPDATHPRLVNRLYYAVDHPARPKSYDTGLPMEVGQPPRGDLVIFEGPTVIRRERFRLVYDRAEISADQPPTPKRVDGWVRAGVHVRGRPDWVFVKAVMHGAIKRDHDAVLGALRDRLHDDLESRYNDGTRYVLHYVTAREAYNIAKAAEQGQTGNPNAYRDFLIPPPVNRYLTASAPYEVVALEEDRLTVDFLVPAQTPVKLFVRGQDIAVSGDVTNVLTTPAGHDVEILLNVGSRGRVTLSRIAR